MRLTAGLLLAAFSGIFAQRFDSNGCEVVPCREGCKLEYLNGCPHNCRCKPPRLDCPDVTCPSPFPTCIVRTKLDQCQECVCQGKVIKEDGVVKVKFNREGPTRSENVQPSGVEIRLPQGSLGGPPGTAPSPLWGFTIKRPSPSTAGRRPSPSTPVTLIWPPTTTHSTTTVKPWHAPFDPSLPPLNAHKGDDVQEFDRNQLGVNFENRRSNNFEQPFRGQGSSQDSQFQNSVGQSSYSGYQTSPIRGNVYPEGGEANRAQGFGEIRSSAQNVQNYQTGQNLGVNRNQNQNFQDRNNDNRFDNRFGNNQNDRNNQNFNQDRNNQNFNQDRNRNNQNFNQDGHNQNFNNQNDRNNRNFNQNDRNNQNFNNQNQNYDRNNQNFDRNNQNQFVRGNQGQGQHQGNDQNHNQFGSHQNQGQTHNQNNQDYQNQGGNQFVRGNQNQNYNQNDRNNQNQFSRNNQNGSQHGGGYDQYNQGSNQGQGSNQFSRNNQNQYQGGQTGSDQFSRNNQGHNQGGSDQYQSGSDQFSRNNHGGNDQHQGQPGSNQFSRNNNQDGYQNNGSGSNQFSRNNQDGYQNNGSGSNQFSRGNNQDGYQNGSGTGSNQFSRNNQNQGGGGSGSQFGTQSYYSYDGRSSNRRPHFRQRASSTCTSAEVESINKRLGKLFDMARDHPAPRDVFMPFAFDTPADDLAQMCREFTEGFMYLSGRVIKSCKDDHEDLAEILARLEIPCSFGTRSSFRKNRDCISSVLKDSTLSSCSRAVPTGAPCQTFQGYVNCARTSAVTTCGPDAFEVLFQYYSMMAKHESPSCKLARL